MLNTSSWRKSSFNNFPSIKNGELKLTELKDIYFIEHFINSFLDFMLSW